MPKAVIVDALRTPIGRFGGGLLEFSASDLATHVLKALIERNRVPVDEVDEVLLGHVLQGGAGVNIARTAAIRAGLPVTICGSTVNMVCASGMKALDMARQAILLGEGSIYLAGGAESMSNVPFYLREMRWGHKLRARASPARRWTPWPCAASSARKRPLRAAASPMRSCRCLERRTNLSPWTNIRVRPPWKPSPR